MLRTMLAAIAIAAAALGAASPAAAEPPTPTPTPPPGAAALCNDGTYSFSQHRKVCRKKPTLAWPIRSLTTFGLMPALCAPVA